MNGFFNKSDELPGSSNQNVLTAAMFFGKHGKYKYFDPNEFLSWGEGLRQEDEAELSAFFQLVKEGVTFKYSRKLSNDKGGALYSYQNFLKPKGPEGVKITLGGKLHQFIKDYHNGKFTVNFTLEDLIEEARKG